MGPDMMARLRGQALLGGLRDALERAPGDPALGPPDAEVSLVYFSDYRCPFCRELSPLLLALLDRTAGLRLVVKEWPIFGGLSIDMARAALLANLSGRYRPVHEALFQERPRTQQALADLLRTLEVPTEGEIAGRPGELVDGQLAATAELAGRLGLRGTPVVIAGQRVVPGYVDAPALEALVAEARAVR